jgi:hypothetical protein
MTRQSMGRLVVAALALAVFLLPATANAQAIIKVNDNVWIRMGVQLQTWGDWLQDSTTRGYSENLYIRRARVLLTGQVAPDVSFFIQTDSPNLGKSPKVITSGLELQDAWFEWRLADAFMIDGGEFLVPLSRNELQGTTSFLTLDISPTSTVFNVPTATNATRDTGFQLHGYLIDGGRLEYRAAAFQGIRVAAVPGVRPASSNAFRESGYLQFNFLEKERGYVFTGTNLGKKAIFNISAGGDMQKDYKAYSGDVFWNLPFGGGNELAGQVQGIHYDGGHFVTAIPRQNDYLVELGVYIAAAKFQPFGKYESQKFSNTIDKPKDQTRWGAGFNYYILGQNLKFTGQYLKVNPKAPLKDTNEFTFQFQVWYY